MYKIFDAHQDILIYEQENKIKTQTSFEKIIKSNLKLVVASIFVLPENKSKLEILNEVENQLRLYLKIIENNKNLTLIKTTDDLEKLMTTNKTGLLLHIEGLDFITKENIDMIEMFYYLGLRSVGLTWGAKNNLGSDWTSEGGITELGKELVQKCNKFGIIIDLAHTNEETFGDIISLSNKPVMSSHGNSFLICDNKRNLKDEQIELLKNNKGVAGIFFSKKFIGSNYNDVLKHFEKFYTLSPNTVMIGSDFGGITSGIVENLESINCLPKLLQDLEKILGPKAAQKIAYENFFNFLSNNLSA